jgi:hypothetical protein
LLDFSRLAQVIWKLVKLALSLLLLLLLTLSASAQVFDASGDFSITNGNPNGTWTYGWSTTLTSTLNNYNTGVLDGNSNQVWYDSTHVSLGAPSAFNNPNAVQQGVLPAHTAGFHPGSADEISHFVWTSPLTGVISLSATFLPVDSGGTTVYILDNGVTIFSAAVFQGTGGSPMFSSLLPVLNGDKIDFAVDFSSGPGDTNFFNDSTGLNATISVVPEPGTVSLLIVALGIAAVTFRRRLI